MDYQQIQKKYLLPTYPNRGLSIVHGDGVKLFDPQGKEYIDCMSSIGVNIIGHNNQFLNRALKKQIDKLICLHSSLNNDTRSLALNKLKEVLPKILQQVYFCNSGAESVESALKFAMAITGKSKFMAAKNGYHGKTLGALSATTSSQAKYQKPFQNFIQHFDLINFNDVSSLKKTISSEHAALLLEPIQGEGGVVLAENNYLQEVSKICAEHNVLLIMDEIQTGMGRTGKMFAYEHYGLVPDILCLAKGLAGGVPAGATIVQNKYREKITVGIHTSTFGGNPLASAGICATLDYLQENNILRNASVVGKYLLEEFKKINSPLIKEVRGVGLMIGLELNRNVMPYIQLLQKKGILVVPTGNTIMRFLPPLTISQKEVNQVLDRLPF